MVVPDLRDAGVRAVRPRRQLQLSGPAAADEWALYCLDRAGQLATCNLYDLADTEPITAFTEKEAARLPEYIVWGYSHEDEPQCPRKAVAGIV